MWPIDARHADLIWSTHKEGFSETASFTELGDYLGLSKEEDMGTAGKILGKHLWFDKKLPYGDSRGYRVDYEGFNRMVQYANEKHQMYEKFNCKFAELRERKRLELMKKFQQDMINEFYDKP